AALGNHHESRHAAPAAGGLWRPEPRRNHAHVRHAHGQGRVVAASRLDRREGQPRGARHLMAHPAPARMVVDLTADDYAEFAVYVYKRPDLRNRRFRSHLRFAILMIV